MRRLAILFAFGFASAAEDAPEAGDLPSQDLKAGEQQRYFLIGPRKDSTAPKAGHALLVVLPGGDGGESFLPFVKGIYKNTLDAGWIVAQPVSVKWSPNQQVIWPTQKVKAAGMKFDTEAFVEAVVAAVKKRHRIDPARIFLLAWSSSGPAAYSLSLQKKKSVTGFYIAMSVFKPETLPEIGGAKGNAYFLDHSPEDKVCPFRMAEDAEKLLKTRGARVNLVSYKGGHGWQGDLYARLREGWKWLEENHAKPGR